MQLRDNDFKRRVLNQERQIGLWSMLCSTLNTELLSDAGFDWLLIDGEHSPLDVPDILLHLHAAQQGRSAVVVRAASCDQTLIKRLLDIGAQTLLIPFIQNAKEARQVVSYCRYPPSGIRGVTGSARGSRYGRIEDYFRNADNTVCILVQVETTQALGVVRDIARVDGVDGVFVGPSDLAASMGHIGNPGHHEVQTAIRSAADEIRSQGKAAGILAPNELDARRYLEWGYSFVAVGVDIGLISRAADTLLRAFKDMEPPR